MYWRATDTRVAIIQEEQLDVSDHKKSLAQVHRPLKKIYTTTIMTTNKIVDGEWMMNH